MKADRKQHCLLLVFSICMVFTFAVKADPCEPIRIALHLETQEASAGFFANLRGAENSIKNRSDAILRSSTAKAGNIEPPPLACPKGCRASRDPKIVFHAVPNRYLDEYDDKARCEEHFKNTSHVPLTWSNAHFEDYEEFSERFSDFSQGEGKYGEELYDKCDGDCSPQYTIQITPHPGEAYTADVFVVCGHARDRDDAMYTLTTSLLWSCVPENS